MRRRDHRTSADSSHFRMGALNDNLRLIISFDPGYRVKRALLGDEPRCGQCRLVDETVPCEPSILTVARNRTHSRAGPRRLPFAYSITSRRHPMRFLVAVVAGTLALVWLAPDGVAA